ncbi:FAD-dependent oxidoreductase [Candidatus Gottesmanbacteria bacterium]|nr:FAD-dependent oxidoreductase [Candidatus Gottesmanbacteria bacterium]
MYDVIILGSGPAGLTAAIYTQRFGLSTVIVAGRKWGGQLMLTTDVENFPGFSHIQGPDLMQKIRDQVAGLGVEIFDLDFTKLDASASLSTGGGKQPFVVTAEDKTLEGKSVIVATGADTRWLGVPNEAKLLGHGVSSCAPCDAFFFKGKSVAVVGGGDSAMEETQVIAKVSPDVVLIHRRDEFRAQKALLDHVMSLKNVRYLYNTHVVDMVGQDNLTGLLLETTVVSPKQNVSDFDALVASFGGIKKSAKQWELLRQGVFVAIGLDPNTKQFEGVELDSHGYVKRYEELDDNGVMKYVTKSSVPGVFTAGDVHDARYKQAVTAAAFGCMAALDVQRWLTEIA